MVSQIGTNGRKKGQEADMGRRGSISYGDEEDRPERQELDNRPKLVLALGLFGVALVLYLLLQPSAPDDAAGGMETVAADLQEAVAALNPLLPENALVALVTEPPGSGDYHKDLIATVEAALEAGGHRVERTAPTFRPEYIPEAKSRPKKWQPALEFWLTADIMELTVREVHEATAVVSLIGYPAEATFRGAEAPLYTAVLMGPAPETEQVDEAFKAKRLHAVALWEQHLQGTWDLPEVTKDVPPQRSFRRGHLLVGGDRFASLREGKTP